MKQQSPIKTDTTPTTLHIIISNGIPAGDTKLTFEFQRIGGPAQVWLLKLPKLNNLDAFPQLISPDTWELRLDAAGETQPLEVTNFTPKSVAKWLDHTARPSGSAPNELLILAHNGGFTSIITEFGRSNGAPV